MAENRLHPGRYKSEVSDVVDMDDRTYGTIVVGFYVVLLVVLFSIFIWGQMPVILLAILIIPIALEVWTVYLHFLKKNKDR